MYQQHFQTLFAYDFATTYRLLEVAEQLDLADYNPNNVQRADSIHQLFVHALSAQRRWRIGLETGERVDHLDAADFASIAGVREAFKHEEQAWQHFLSDPHALEGEAFGFERWRILQHIILHGMQHHTEIATLLTNKGHSPGDIDFILFKNVG